MEAGGRGAAQTRPSDNDTTGTGGGWGKGGGQNRRPGEIPTSEWVSEEGDARLAAKPRSTCTQTHATALTLSEPVAFLRPKEGIGLPYKTDRVGLKAKASFQRYPCGEAEDYFGERTPPGKCLFEQSKHLDTKPST